MDYLTLSMAAVAMGFSVGSFVRKRNEVHHNLRVQLDEAIAENARLLEERAKLQDALHAAEVKVSPETLAKYADEAVAYAEQMCAPGTHKRDKLRVALDACKLRDAGDNGKRDWTDAEHRIAIEAALARKKLQ